MSVRSHSAHVGAVDVKTGLVRWFTRSNNACASSNGIAAVPMRFRPFTRLPPGRGTGFGRFPFFPVRCQFAACNASTADASKCSLVDHKASSPCSDRASAEVDGKFAISAFSRHQGRASVPTSRTSIPSVSRS